MDTASAAKPPRPTREARARVDSLPAEPPAGAAATVVAPQVRPLAPDRFVHTPQAAFRRPTGNGRFPPRQPESVVDGLDGSRVFSSWLCVKLHISLLFPVYFRNFLKATLILFEYVSKYCVCLRFTQNSTGVLFFRCASTGEKGRKSRRQLFGCRLCETSVSGRPPAAYTAPPKRYRRPRSGADPACTIGR